jgi:hypothetical protein
MINKKHEAARLDNIARARRRLSVTDHGVAGCFSLTDIARDYGLSPATINARYHAGDRGLEALTRPTRPTTRVFQGKTFEQWSVFYALRGREVTAEQVSGGYFYFRKTGLPDIKILERQMIEFLAPADGSALADHIKAVRAELGIKSPKTTKSDRSPAPANTKTRLILAVKGRWFEEIKAGTKQDEYRLCTTFWHKRLSDRIYDDIEITLGYPRRDEPAKRLLFEFDGVTMEQVVSPEWDNVEQSCFAVSLRKPMFGHGRDSNNT